jgi:hypothetical protein
MSDAWFLDREACRTRGIDDNCTYNYVGVLKNLWLFLFLIFLFAAQPK